MEATGRIARGYDLYGNIAVIDAPPRAAKYLARRLLRETKNVETVLRKGSAVKGRYRTRKFVYVAGKRNYIATYRENGCIFRFDIRKVFFSTRLAYERKRVGDLVKDGENVLVMFAGVGPYAIEIAKTHRRCKVVSIELGSAASRYAAENVRLNKLSNVIVEQGSVEKFTEKYAHFADRVIMPLPKDMFSFLPTTLRMCATRCVLHCYFFSKSDKTAESLDRLELFFKSHGKKYRLLHHRVVRPYSAKDVEVAADLLVY